ncbi:MAG: hypothetical protein D6761_02215 [Candidatus Dadabacteria bacterium]|nr:MAG: hypothetical protein D6761_02215 [Candidatus Dadabacteria bacterium]
MPFLRLLLLLVASASILLPFNAEAQLPGVQPFALNQRLANIIVEVAQYQPPFKLAPKKQLLTKLFNKPTVVVYWIPGQKPSEKAALELSKRATGWKNIDALLIMRGLNQQEVSRGLDWVQQQQITIPVVIDRSMELALGLQAVRVPSYAVVDAGGVLKIRKVSDPKKRTAAGPTLDDILSAAEQGKPVPVADGEMREDTRMLIGETAPDVKVSAAPFSKTAKPETRTGGAGKPRLVVFWLATCPHCQREMPRIHAWWQAHKDDIELITVTRTDSEGIRAHTIKYLSSKGIADIPVYSASADAYRQWKVEGIPTWAVVGSNGKVIEARVGEDPQLPHHLNQALAKAR